MGYEFFGGKKVYFLPPQSHVLIMTSPLTLILTPFFKSVERVSAQSYPVISKNILISGLYEQIFAK